MLGVGINEESAPPAEATKISPFLFDVSDQLPTCKRGSATELMMSNTLVCVVCRVCPDARDLIPEP
jgi:hypothetical protein